MASKKKKQGGSILPFILFVCVVGLGYAYTKSPLGQQVDLSQPKPVKPTVEEMKNGNSRQINEDTPGEEIDIAKHKVSGHFTIFDFYSESCGPCMRIAPELLELTKERPDIAVRSIDVDRGGTQGIDWNSPVCQQYKIHSLPHFVIMNSDGRIVAQGRAASDAVIKLIQKANYQ